MTAPADNLTPRQRVDLRRRGQRLRPLLSVGRGGLSGGFVQQVQAVFASHDLIKIRVAATEGGEVDLVGEELARLVPCHVVARTGFVLVLYAPQLAGGAARRTAEGEQSGTQVREDE